MPNYPTCVEPPTVVARHFTPKSSGVEGFAFPIYCVVTSRKGKREKRVFQTWQPQRDKGGGFGCSIALKQWSSLSYLSAKIKQAVKSKGDSITVASPEQVDTIGRHQRVLWSNAFKSRNISSGKVFTCEHHIRECSHVNITYRHSNHM